MAFVVSTDLAAVRTDKGPILYYQKDANIYEAKLVDSKWISSAVLKGDPLESWGGSFTAYYVENDGSNDMAHTIHVVLKDKSCVLRELVRKTSDTEWKEMQIPQDSENKIESNSKIASGVCHDDPSNKSHQWLFFVSTNPDTTVGGVIVSELRKGTESQFNWAPSHTLPQNRGTALEGTKMTAHLTNSTTYLYFQNHNEEIVQYHWTNTKWSGENLFRDKSKVVNNSALATAGPTTEDNPHLFFVENVSGQNKIKHSFQGKETELATWVGGSNIGAITCNDITYLFYVGADKPTNIQVQKFEKGTWGKGEIVV